jgi:hypothetical protein
VPDVIQGGAVADLLERFRNGSASDRDAALIALICDYARPEIRRIIIRRRGRGIRPQDCPDVQATAEAGLARVFLRGNVEIRNFASYVRTAARNAVCEHIRGPGYRKAVYHICNAFLACRKELRLWKRERQRIGGYLDWQEQDRAPTRLASSMDCIERRLNKLDFTSGTLHVEVCIQAVKGMLDCAGDPALLQELATVFGSFAGLIEPAHVSASDEEVVSVEWAQIELDRVQARELIEVLEKRAQFVPRKARASLLLGFPLEEWVMAGIATQTQLGRLLGIDPNENRKLLIDLIRSSPLNDAEIEDKLSIRRPRQHRHRGLERVRELLKKLHDRGLGKSEGNDLEW